MRGEDLAQFTFKYYDLRWHRRNMNRYAHLFLYQISFLKMLQTRTQNFIFGNGTPTIFYLIL
jgi:hypothetical protein